MPGLRCTVAVCKNSWEKGQKDGKKVKFFCFPKDSELRQQWVDFCQRGGKWKPDFGRICEDHFKEIDFERDLSNELLGLPTRKLLKKDAVPSLLGPTSKEKKNKRRGGYQKMVSKKFWLRQLEIHCKLCNLCFTFSLTRTPKNL